MIIYILKGKFQRNINEIQSHLYKTIMENFNKRVHMCQNRGGHLSDMLFHI